MTSWISRSGGPGRHSQAGYSLLRTFAPLARAAELVRFHHVPWDHGQGASFNGDTVPWNAHLIHLADRASILISDKVPLLGQVFGICENVARRSGSSFVPEQVDAFLALKNKDYVWLETGGGSLPHILERDAHMCDRQLNLDELLDFSRLLCRTIDFKSSFTATHSSGVAAVAMRLAELTGFSPEECRMMEIAALLHDLGKLAIPSEILEKPGLLDDNEWHIMRSHVFYTYEILEPIEALTDILNWGALHQERLDGSGYPFARREEDIPLGARVMAVADVFVALTETRPYRDGMEKITALEVLEGMADCGELDASIVKLAAKNFDILNTVRADTQANAANAFDVFRTSL